MSEAIANAEPAAVDPAVVEGADPNIEPVVEPAVDDVSEGDVDADASLAQGGGDDEKVVPTDFPDDWQQKMAGGDEKLAKKLGRYASPAAVAKALEETQTKLRTGLEPPKPPAADASDEEKAEYRAKAGIPADLDGYTEALKLPDGIQLGDDDKPIVDAFAKDFLDANIPPEHLSVAVNRYMQMQEEAANLQAQQDEDYRINSLAELKQEYGAKYQANLNALSPFFDGMDVDIFDNLMGGRMADGSRIGDNPNAMRFFVSKALEANPASTVVPPSADQGKAIADEIASMERRMSEDRNGWFADKPAQERYRELLEVQEKLGG